jgi:hypothetical protein
MQAVSGIADIGPLTFGELLHACKAKVDFDWGQTAALMALTANCHRGKNQRPYKRDDFYRPQLNQRKKRGNMSIDKLYALRPMFTKKG